MRIGFLHTIEDQRIPINDTIIKKYINDGWTVVIQHEIAANIQDTEQVEKLLRKDILKTCDVIYSNKNLTKTELSLLKKEACFISFLEPFNNKKVNQSFKGLNIQVFSLDMIPRTTLAQSMDCLSSMASIAGYKAVLLAAENLPRYLPMMMTAAGTIRPATTLVIGAGVAGLQAIATAKRLGSKILSFDVRIAVKTEVESLGAKFVEIEGAKDDIAAGGYAVLQTEEYQNKQKAAIYKAAKNSDIIITTAQLRGRPAPILITESMVKDMKPGSIIIDLASSTGGNCELTKNNEKIIVHGVTIIGNSHLYLLAIEDAATLLGNNIYNFTKIFHKDGAINLDMENEIIEKSMIYSLKHQK